MAFGLETKLVPILGTCHLRLMPSVSLAALSLITISWNGSSATPGTKFLVLHGGFGPSDACRSAGVRGQQPSTLTFTKPSLILLRMCNMRSHWIVDKKELDETLWKHMLGSVRALNRQANK